MTNSTTAISAANQQKNIEKASRATNPFEFVAGSLSFEGKDKRFYTFYSKRKADLEAKTLKYAFKLAEKNVSPFYKTLEMGWQPKIKQNDLNKNWARYLIALDDKKNAVAYAMFRFDIDYGHSVLYCYELQIEKESQNLGLGKFMMKCLEDCAKHWQMEKIVLTVLKNNTNAMSFFKKIGFTLDDSSPDVLEKAEYEILSKAIL